jgi:hypothetical protein
MKRCSASVVALAWACATPSIARAQADDQRAARPLFEEGRRLLKAGSYAEACPKFEAAAKLYAGPGVFLNLGDCYEHIGRTASAWAAFADAAAAATRVGHAVDEAEATKRRAAVEPKLSMLTIRVTQTTPGLVVRRNRQVVEAPAWGTPIPVDPGPQAVTAEATGFTGWSDTVDVARPGEWIVDVPVLPPLPEKAEPRGIVAPPPTPAAERADATPAAGAGRSQRILALVLGGAGAVTATAGGVLAVSAKSQFDTARGESGDARHADSQRAVDRGNVATGVALTGGILIAAGLVLWLTAPRGRVAF